MVKKLVTIDVNDENLTISAKSVNAKTAKVKEETEMEKLGFVEINSASAKKAKSASAKGYEKNVSESVKRGVKAKTSMVEDYFDFSFRVNEKAKETVEEKNSAKTAKAKTAKSAAKTSTKTSKSTAKAKSTTLKIDDNLKKEQDSNLSSSVSFDNEANQIIRVARIGSLFDCDKRIIQA